MHPRSLEDDRRGDGKAACPWVNRPRLQGARGWMGTWEEAVHEYDVHGTDRGREGVRTDPLYKEVLVSS